MAKPRHLRNAPITEAIIDVRVKSRKDFAPERFGTYTSWEELSPQAFALWRQYVAVAEPESVTRLALRYINHIPLPLSIELTDYLTAGPVIPPELPQYLEAFLTQVLIHDPTTEVAATIRQTLERGLTPDKLTVLLDIDAFKATQLESDSPAIDQTFQQLHEFKNTIFFSSITETTAELFE
ncbi:MAG: TIGR04255 family protein [Gemmatimonadetes bacterium]|nr:TIGR04255 family protein [Gemmatimonadota bacterium]